MNGVSGYDAGVFGTAIGVDTLISPNLTLGLAAGFSDTGVETDLFQKTDITSYTGIAYGKIGIANFYVDAFAAYSINSYDSYRPQPNGESAHGDYDGNQYSLKLKLGYDFQFDNTLTVTPLVSVHKSSLSIDSYSESGSTFAKDYEKKDADMLKLGFGLELGYSVRENLISTLRIISLNDTELETETTTSSFTAVTGDTINSVGASTIDKTSLVAGFGLTYFADGVSLSGNYNFETKDNFEAHSYDLLLRMQF